MSVACVQSLRSLAIALGLVLGLAACTALDAGPAGQTGADAAGLGGQELSRVYRLGIGDKLKITVFGEPDLSGSFEVGALGSIAMPLIGEVMAKGQGVHELRDTISRKLAGGYLKDPKVGVEVLNYRPFFVHGEVRSGGEFAFKNGVTLRDAVAMAGGYTYRANQRYVVLIREGEQTERRVALPSALAVLPGDNIRIPERFF